jgi:hypothetical protein
VRVGIRLAPSLSAQVRPSTASALRLGAADRVAMAADSRAESGDLEAFAREFAHASVSREKRARGGYGRCSKNELEG